VFDSQLVLPDQFVDTAKSPSFLEKLQYYTMPGDSPPPMRHNSSLTLTTLPEEMLLAHFVLVYQDAAQLPLNPL
jgi:hypothetical protein